MTITIITTSNYYSGSELIYTSTKRKTEEHKMNTTYTFTKDGKKYSAKGSNRFDAQLKIEVAYGISLEGAKFEEVYKLRTICTGTVR